MQNEAHSRAKLATGCEARGTTSACSFWDCIGTYRAMKGSYRGYTGISRNTCILYMHIYICVCVYIYIRTYIWRDMEGAGINGFCQG